MIVVDPNNFGEQLLAYRQALGISRLELAQTIAAATGKTQKGVAAQLWFWESGRRQPLPSQFGQWLAALGLKLAIVPEDGPDAALVRKVIQAAHAVLHAKLREPGIVREPELTARIMDLGDALAALSTVVPAEQSSEPDNRHYGAPCDWHRDGGYGWKWDCRECNPDHPAYAQHNYGAVVGGIPMIDPGCISNGYHNTSCLCGSTFRDFQRSQHKSDSVSGEMIYEVHEPDSKCGCPMEGMKHGGPHRRSDHGVRPGPECTCVQASDTGHDPDCPRAAFARDGRVRQTMAPDGSLPALNPEIFGNRCGKPIVGTPLLCGQPAGHNSLCGFGGSAGSDCEFAS